jgi:hypothetical protein
MVRDSTRFLLVQDLVTPNVSACSKRCNCWSRWCFWTPYQSVDIPCWTPYQSVDIPVGLPTNPSISPVGLPTNPSISPVGLPWLGKFVKIAIPTDFCNILQTSTKWLYCHIWSWCRKTKSIEINVWKLQKQCVFFILVRRFDVRNPRVAQLRLRSQSCQSLMSLLKESRWPQ